jgi:glutamine synthetase
MTIDERIRGLHTIMVAVPDNVGRLMGKRVMADAFVRSLTHGLPMPDYFLVTWLDNEPQDGFAVTGWHTGWRNATLLPDLETLRRLPGEPGIGLVISDTVLADGAPAPMAARQLLARQLDRAATRGITPICASELEFWLFEDSYRYAHASRYRDLATSHHRLQDNDLLQAAADESFVGQLRDELSRLDVEVVVCQGEGGDGQHELNLAHVAMKEAADRVALYKHTAKSIAYRQDRAVTFMAKWDGARASSSGHVHLSLDGDRGEPLLWDESRHGLSDLGKNFLAGLIRYSGELMVLHAPFVNSYKRLTAGSFAPTNLSWGYDNRTVCFRLVGTGRSFRIECRMPGADANPYWSYAGLMIAGLEGIEQSLAPPAATTGNAYDDARPAHLPVDLRDALGSFSDSAVARAALGTPTHDHISGLIAHELEQSRKAVSEWELQRGFEVV